jgi:hypothetical protein
MAAQIDEQIELAGLATQIRKLEVPVGFLTQKVRLWRIQLTQKARLQKIQLRWKIGPCKTQGGGHETGRRKMCCSKQKAGSMMVPKGYYQDTKMQITKDAPKRVG